MTDFIVNPPDNTCSEPTPNSGASLSSQVTYDGVTLNCLDIQNLGQNLNSVLSSINTVVCSLEASISSNATNISTNTTNITNVNTTISNLDGTDIADGNSYSCITGGATIAATLTELEALVCSIQSGSSLTPELVADVDGIQEFNGAITKPLVIEGSASGKFDTSGISGFTGTIAGGKVVPQDGKVRDVAGAGVTVNANKDTYFYGKSTGSLAKKEVNNGDPQPSTSNDEVVLWKFVSDGAGITGTTDLRVYEPFDETLFRSTTNVSTFIPNGSIGSSKLDLSAKLQYTAVHALTDPKDITHKSYVDALLSGGTTNFVSKFTASGLANSLIRDDGSNISIGATIDSNMSLLVSGTDRDAGNFYNTASSGTSSNGLVIRNFSTHSSGAATGLRSTVLNSTTSGNSVAIDAVVTSAGTNSYGITVDVQNGTNKYGIVVEKADNYNGFGTSTPTGTIETKGKDNAATINMLLKSNGGTQLFKVLNNSSLGFFAATPVTQPNGTGETVGFTAGAGTGVNDDSTFTGNVGTTAYRISDVVKALKNLGLLAQ